MTRRNDLHKQSGTVLNCTCTDIVQSSRYRSHRTIHIWVSHINICNLNNIFKIHFLRSILKKMEKGQAARISIFATYKHLNNWDPSGGLWWDQEKVYTLQWWDHGIIINTFNILNNGLALINYFDFVVIGFTTNTWDFQVSGLNEQLKR